MNTDYLIKFADRWAKMGKRDKEIISYLNSLNRIFHGNCSDLARAMNQKHRTPTTNAVNRLEKMGLIIVVRSEANRMTACCMHGHWTDNLCRLCESEIVNSNSHTTW